MEDMNELNEQYQLLQENKMKFIKALNQSGPAGAMIAGQFGDDALLNGSENSKKQQ